MTELPQKRAPHRVVDITELVEKMDLSACFSNLTDPYRIGFVELFRRFVFLNQIRIDQKKLSSVERSKLKNRRNRLKKSGKILFPNIVQIHAVRIALAHCASNGGLNTNIANQVYSLLCSAKNGMDDLEKKLVGPYINFYLHKEKGPKRFERDIDRDSKALCKMGIAEMVIIFQTNGRLDIRLYNFRDSIAQNDMQNMLIFANKNGILASVSDNLKAQRDVIKLDGRFRQDLFDTKVIKPGRKRQRVASKVGLLSEAQTILTQSSEQIAEWIRKSFQ